MGKIEELARLKKEKSEPEYPKVEVLTFNCKIQSQEQGYALLKVIDSLISKLGIEFITNLANEVEKNPQAVSLLKK